jgi:glycosyltransferase involved in cell wall biosynthesis
VDLVVGSGFYNPTQIDVQHFKYKVIDLNRWKPKEGELDISSKKIRILHSHSLESRSHNKLNIKGSEFVIDAMERLCSEFPHVEFIQVSGIDSSQMIQYQSQADIVVDQLIYGHWGSTGIEAMALGKVLVCYVRPSWKEFFLEKFPEYDGLPVVQATRDSVYQELRGLIEDESERVRLGLAARKFAEQHYDPQRNSQNLISMLRSL